MIKFNHAQEEGKQFHIIHKKEKELSFQIPTGGGKTYLIQDLTLDREYENIIILVMSRLIVVRQIYSKYYKNINYLQIEFFCSEDEKDEPGDNIDDFELPKVDSYSTTKRKIIFTTYVSFPKLVNFLKETNQLIDMTIFDEAHNCAGEKVSNILNDETKKKILGVYSIFLCYFD